MIVTMTTDSSPASSERPELPKERDVIIRPTEFYGDRSIDYTKPLIVVANSFNGTDMRIGSTVRLFHAEQGPSKELITGWPPFRRYSTVHQFGVISQDFPYSLFLDNQAELHSWDLGTLLNPELILEDVFDFVRKDNAKEDFRITASRLINEKIYQVAKGYAEHFAVKSGAFKRIVDDVSRCSYDIEETRAYRMHQAILSSSLRLIGAISH